MEGRYYTKIFYSNFLWMDIGRLRTYALSRRQLVYPLYLNQKVFLPFKHLNPFCCLGFCNSAQSYVNFLLQSRGAHLRSQVPILVGTEQVQGLIHTRSMYWQSLCIESYNGPTTRYRFQKTTELFLILSTSCLMIWKQTWLLNVTIWTIVSSSHVAIYRENWTKIHQILDMCCWCFTICMMAW